MYIYILLMGRTTATAYNTCAVTVVEYIKHINCSKQYERLCRRINLSVQCDCREYKYKGMVS